MILRSLTKHVKDQNWFAVGLDFVIVVCGVFIGIQVANWNETQAERAQTQRLLSELVIDLAEMRGRVARISNFYLENMTLVDALLNSLDAGDRTNPDEIAATFDRVLALEVPPSPPARLNELLVSGRLDLLSDASVRDALRRLEVDSASAARATEALLDAYISITAPLLPYLSNSRKPDFDYRKEPFEKVIAVDIEALWSDAKARDSLAALYNFHANMRVISQVTKDSIDAFLATAPERGY